ncbi:sugar phosphate isomerase/epimerase [Oceanidesulfovibrio indonesiensis]|uniref:Sugar phosphate isomerase/epimerase n=2 Tax=Oceanidesulfovibrio indonesiensis TaxID=54767 RepID=A0A7M3MBI2_9BACT|nr:sugar phosphate isomerase/epimerase [Oceanidesulfovibrio indonesiensis]
MFHLNRFFGYAQRMHCFLALPLKRMAMEPLWLEDFLGSRNMFMRAMVEAPSGADVSEWFESVQHTCGEPQQPVLAPEIDLDAYTIERLGMAWCRGVAGRLEDTGLECAVHLPFLDLHPASLDSKVLVGTRQSLERAMEFAYYLAPSHLIAHSGYDPQQHVDQEYEEYLGRSKETWVELLDQWPNHPPLFIENTYEKNPEPLRDLVTILHSKCVGICFDVGHWNSFALGSLRQDMDRWIKVLGPYIGHLHLHDNDGTGDTHQGLGQGTVPWGELMNGLRRVGIAPGCTLEPHSQDALLHSFAFMKTRKDLFEQMLRHPYRAWGR